MDRRSGGYVRRTQEERRQESESRLLAAAVKLIAEKVENGFTLAEVGHEAGYSRSLPGHYFENKEALPDSVVENKQQQSLAPMCDHHGQRGSEPMGASCTRPATADAKRGVWGRRVADRVE